VGYREYAPPAALRDTVECSWVVDGPPAPVRVLPDGCMDLIRMNGRIMVAGPDTNASVSPRGDGEPFVGLRFRPGALPRLLGVPAAELRNQRVPLGALRSVASHRSLVDVAVALDSEAARPETAPWSLPLLRHVTAALAGGAPVSMVARDIGWSTRTLQRHCSAVYGYGPATLRRVLRFRRAVALVNDGNPPAEVAARAGYADQPHLHREVRELAGVALSQLASGANRSTQLPSGSATVA